ncbi:MAG: YARHG domain-containing protein [Lachnospiraceae bacterium]|nr:YARHG domain-containing protein [Lachnospiraceae bacterium]
MFCTKCGANLPDGVKFCTRCGAPVGKTNAVPMQRKSVTRGNHQGQGYPPVRKLNREKKKNRIGKIVIPILLIALLAAGGSVYAIKREREVNLNRYIEVAFSGYDGYGTAEVSFQYDKFRKDHKDLILNRSQMDDSLAKALDDTENGSLKNGDTLTLKGILTPGLVDRSQEGRVTHIIEAPDYSVSVESLSETKEIDPFENVKVEYSGYDGYGTIDVEKSEKSTAEGDGSQDWFTYSCPNTGSLQNGDTVTVSVKLNGYGDADDFTRQNGYTLSQTEKEYTVSGLTATTKIDPFENLEVQYDGISPALKVSVNEGLLTEPVKGNVTFSVENTGTLKVGDTFKIQAKAGSQLVKKGYALDPTEKEYTVEASEVDKYLEATDDADLTPLNDQLDDFVEASLSQYVGKSNQILNILNVKFTIIYNWTTESIDSIQRVAAYLANSKEEQVTDDDEGTPVVNRYFALYKISMTGLGVCKDEEQTTSYLLVWCDNVISRSDGTFVWASEDSTEGNKIYTDSQAHESDQVVARNVTAMKGNYNVTELSSSGKSVNKKDKKSSLSKSSKSSDDAEYLLPSSDTKEYSASYFDGYTKDELNMFINEIYAKHGRKFKTDSIQKYFDSKSWYQPKVEPDDFDSRVKDFLNDVEYKNVKTIVSVREKLSS